MPIKASKQSTSEIQPIRSRDIKFEFPFIFSKKKYTRMFVRLIKCLFSGQMENMSPKHHTKDRSWCHCYFALKYMRMREWKIFNLLLVISVIVGIQREMVPRSARIVILSLNPNKIETKSYYEYQTSLT